MSTIKSKHLKHRRRKKTSLFIRSYNLHSIMTLEQRSPQSCCILKLSHACQHV